MFDVSSSPPPHSRGSTHAQNISVKRTFKGDGSDIWTEYIRYFENIAELNDWNEDRKRKVFFTALRGQAETYVYGLSESVRNDWNLLVEAMYSRFGHKAMKESYIAEAKLRRKRQNETFRDFGQAIQDLYRRAYPENREYVQEGSVKTFLDNCSENEDFRLAVKRTRPLSMDEAVTSAMQEECIRLTENRKFRDQRNQRPPIYQVQGRTDEIRNQRKGFINKGQYKNTESDSQTSRATENRQQRKCYRCGSSEHLLRNCPVKSVKPITENTDPKPETTENELNRSRPRL